MNLARAIHIPLAAAALLFPLGLAASASAKARQIARPMPPPAPLTSATFPVSFIAALPIWSEHYRAAVDGDRLAGDKAACVRDQPSYRADEVGRG